MNLRNVRAVVDGWLSSVWYVEFFKPVIVSPAQERALSLIDKIPQSFPGNSTDRNVGLVMKKSNIFEKLNMSKLFLILRHRRALLAFIFGLASLFECAAWADYPDKPVKFIVPFSAGSGTDAVARVLATALEPALGVPVVVENRPGAGGMLGTDALAKASPDGYTIGITSSATHSASPYLYANVPYDPVKGFVHVTNMVGASLMLAVADGFAHDFAEFTNKASKGKLSFGYGSSTSQVAAATFANLSKITVLPVPYKSQPQVLTDLIGGRVDFMFADSGVLDALLRSGRVRALAITSPTRSPKYPQVPTLDELGIRGYDLSTWVGLGLPAGTPRNIAERWNTEILKLLAREDIRAKFNELNVDIQPNGIEAHTAFVEKQLEVWGRRIKQAGMKPE